MIINLKQDIDALESTNEVYTVLYDIQTSETVYSREITIHWCKDAGVEYMIFMNFRANLRVLLEKQKKKYNLLWLPLWTSIW